MSASNSSTIYTWGLGQDTTYDVIGFINGLTDILDEVRSTQKVSDNCCSNSLAVDETRQQLYLGTLGGLAVWDIPTRTYKGGFPVNQPVSVKVDESTGYIYVVNSAGQLFVVDSSTLEAIGIYNGVGAFGYIIALNPVSKKLYLAYQDDTGLNNTRVFDISNPTPTKIKDVQTNGRATYRGEFHIASNTLHLVDRGSRTVIVVNGQTDEVVQTITYASFPNAACTIKTPHDIAVNQQSGHIYLTSIRETYPLPCTGNGVPVYSVDLEVLRREFDTYTVFQSLLNYRNMGADRPNDHRLVFNPITGKAYTVVETYNTGEPRKIITVVQAAPASPPSPNSTILRLDANAPITLSVAQGQYSPNPFAISATVSNMGSAVARNVVVELLPLPTQLSLAPSSTPAIIRIEQIPVGGIQQISWSVQAASQIKDITLTYRLNALATNAQTTLHSGSILLPAVLPNDGIRKVIVFLEGIGTNLTTNEISRLRADCVANDLFFGGIKFALKEKGFTCDDFLHFSYNGGVVNRQGNWQTTPYACSDTGQKLQTSVGQLYTMLRSYRKIYPDKEFILVGHSLGGVVAIRTVERALANTSHGLASAIHSVITIDSPLNYVSEQNYDDIRRVVPADLAYDFLIPIYGEDNVCQIQMLRNSTLSRQIGIVKDSNRQTIRASVEKIVSDAQGAGIRFMTTGNAQDCTWYLALCNMPRLRQFRSWQPLGGQWIDDTQTMIVNNAEVARLYDLGAQDCNVGNSVARLGCIGYSHGVAMKTPNVLTDIRDFIGAQGR